jgi:hypothetical protein
LASCLCMLSYSCGTNASSWGNFGFSLFHMLVNIIFPCCLTSCGTFICFSLLVGIYWKTLRLSWHACYMMTSCRQPISCPCDRFDYVHPTQRQRQATHACAYSFSTISFRAYLLLFLRYNCIGDAFAALYLIHARYRAGLAALQMSQRYNVDTILQHHASSTKGL